MFQKVLVLSGLIAATLTTPSLANERYRERPPVIVSPDLNAPWVMQLQGSQRVQPRVHYPPQAQPRAGNRPTAQRQHQQPKARTQVPVHAQQARPARSQQVAMAGAPARKQQHQIAPQFLPQIVDYKTSEAPGTIVIDTQKRFLYLVMKDGKARRYGVGVGKPGFEWAGTHKVTRKAEWPDWYPPKEMIAREAKKGNHLPVHMAGGPANPMGARAMYLGSTLYRIHGTNAPWTIGTNTSSGCIRMRNEDVTDLYERVPVGAKVIVI